MRTSIHWRQLLGFVGLLTILCLSAPVYAATTPTSGAASADSSISSNVTQSYAGGAGVQNGMIVALQTKNSTTVIPLVSGNIKNMLGVVVPSTNAAIVLTPQAGTAHQVLVATAGHYALLVSNQNGPIKSGDLLTISSVNGVAMKATPTQPEVIGRAAANFSGSDEVISSLKLKGSNGQVLTVAIGSIPATIAVSHNPLYQPASSGVPGVASKLAAGIAGKPVSAFHVYLSIGVLLMASVLTGVMLYSGITGGMQAIGRNPLSRKTILRSLLQTTIVAMLIFVTGIFTVYLLLKL